MIMDYLHDCYYSSMRLYKDRPDILTPGRWHWCEPGAKKLPFGHLFTSSQLDDQTCEFTPLGEVFSGKTKIWRGTNIEGCDGQHYCGTPLVYQQGSLYANRGKLPLDQKGVPACCGRHFPMRGGDADDAAASQVLAWVQAAEGGDSDTGLSVSYTTYTQTGQGGDSEGRVSVQYTTYTQPTEGGDSEGGVSVQYAGFFQSGQGGDSEGGVGVQYTSYTQSGQGGDSDDGVGVQYTSYTQPTEGGDSDDGVGVQFVDALQLGEGGDSEGGVGDQSAPLPAVPGTDCTSALVPTLPYTASWNVPTSGNHWFKFAPANGTTYHVRISGVTFGRLIGCAATKGDCPSQSPLFVVMTPGCNSASAGSEAYWMVHVTGDIMGAADYTIEIASGGC